MAVGGSNLKIDYVHSILFIIIKHEYTFYLLHVLLAYCLSYCYENTNRHNEYSFWFIIFLFIWLIITYMCYDLAHLCVYLVIVTHVSYDCCDPSIHNILFLFLFLVDRAWLHQRMVVEER
jgi:hypothetical protein